MLLPSERELEGLKSGLVSTYASAMANVPPQFAPQQLAGKLSQTAFAFRGYNVTNLGRTSELLQIDAYRPALEKWLAVGSEVCQQAHVSSTDLAARVVGKLEADLQHYAEAVALVMAVEMAQLEVLRDVHGIEYDAAKLAYGYSLGELSAVAANGIIDPALAMSIPVTLAPDSAALAREVRMGIVFSRTESIDEDVMVRLCDEITSECQGVVGISAVLSPNTYLVLGQHDTLTTFKQQMKDVLPKSSLLKRDPNHWPPLHTAIVRNRHIPDRASVMMEQMPAASGNKQPQLFSLATGSASYGTLPTREILRRWVDHPQRLWDAVTHTLQEDIGVVIHVGPGPNVIPATFNRLSDNVSQQLAQLSLSGLGMRAVSRLASSRLANRLWLANLLPQRAFLLRAPAVQHVVLEDWLIENAP